MVPGTRLLALSARTPREGRYLSAHRSIPLGKSDAHGLIAFAAAMVRMAVLQRCAASLRLGRDGAVIGLGNKEGPFILRLGNGLPPGLGFSWGQRREDLLLIALDTLRARHDRDKLRETLHPPQPERMEAVVEARIGNTARTSSHRR